MGRIVLTVMLVAIALSMVSCEQESHGQARAVARVESLEGRLGKACIVYLRHDALGVQREAPLAFAGWRDSAVEGTLLGADDSWMIVKRPDGRESWVPRGNILLVEFTPAE
jgi:hypothetical protein